MIDEQVKQDSPPEYDVPDDENPEWTEADFARARPFAAVFPQIAAKNQGGRPKVDSSKVRMAFRFPARMAAAIKAKGKGFNARVEAVLQQAMDEGRL